MNELLSKLNILIKLLEDFKEYYIEELKRKDLIIKAQKNYIKDLEKFIDSV